MSMKRRIKTESITFRCSKILKDKIKSIADESMMHDSDVIREILENEFGLEQSYRKPERSLQWSVSR